MKSKSPIKNDSHLEINKSTESLLGKCSSSNTGISLGHKKLSKLIEEAAWARKKKFQHLKKRNRIKLALGHHQKLEVQLEYSAIFIQKHIKGYLARKHTKEMLIEKYHQENFILQVQKEISDYWVQDNCIKHMAAYKIQRYWKGFRKIPQRVNLLQRHAKKILILKQFSIFRHIKQRLMGLIKKIISKKIEKNSDLLSEAMGKLRKYQRTRKNSEVALESVKLSEDSVIEESFASEEIDLFKEERSEILEIRSPTPQPEIYPKLLPLPTSFFSRPKLFILSEANYVKPTISSKFKRSESPESPMLQPMKIKRAKTLKSKKNLRHSASKIEYLKKTTLAVKNKAEQDKIQSNSESKLPKTIAQNKYSHVQSKFQEFRVNSGIRNRSIEPIQREVVFSKGNNEKCLPLQKALPELYEFVEKYGRATKKNEIVKSRSSLVILSITRK